MPFGSRFCVRSLFLFLLGGAGALDRLVEFSSRTLPRLDQLHPGPVPTTVLRDGPTSPRWLLTSTTGQLRPAASPALCLQAARVEVASAVSLQQCGNDTHVPPTQRWQWIGSASVMQLLDSNVTLCLSATPIGILDTLSLAECNSSALGTQWLYAGANGSLVTTIGRNQVALFPDSIHPGVRALIDRLKPIFDGAGDDDGQVLMGCFGWMLDLAMLFTGSPQQQLPIINPESPQWSTGNATYNDLRLLIREMRIAALARGLPRLQFGVLFVGWARLYNLQSNFSLYHPEVYINNGAQLAHGHAWNLNPDTYPYASSPTGVASGTSFFELFGKQWAALSSFLNFDVIILRDGLSGFADGGRHGPFGDSASTNASENQLWIDGIIELHKQVKLASPTKKVFGYNQQGSSVGNWRVGLSDLESLVADGFVDAWVTQSWSGAWEDVPTRHSKTQGWTYQLAFILMQRAQIEGGNRKRISRCKHYVLHGLFDAYEGFDTIHQVPSKLEWGIRAYTIASLTRPGSRNIFLDGHYLSWANSYSYVTGSVTNPLDDDNYLDRPTGLLTRTDIDWLSKIFDSADVSISKNSGIQISGPTAFYDRASLEAIMINQPADNVNEWLDEQLGLILKYAVPLARIARIEDGIFPEDHSDGIFLSVVSKSSITQDLVANITTLAAKGSPVVILGRCDVVAPALLKLSGVQCQSTLSSIEPAYYGPAVLTTKIGTTSSTVSIGLHGKVLLEKGSKAIAVGQINEPDGIFMARLGNVTYAQLNDYTYPVRGNLAVQNYGQSLPHFLLATDNTWGSLRVVDGMDETQPITLHMWQEASKSIFLLAGNLEQNYCGGLPCSVPSQLSSRFITAQIDTKLPSVNSWLMTASDSSIEPQVLVSENGFLKIFISLPYATGRLYKFVPIADAY